MQPWHREKAMPIMAKCRAVARMVLVAGVVLSILYYLLCCLSWSFFGLYMGVVFSIGGPRSACKKPTPFSLVEWMSLLRLQAPGFKGKCVLLHGALVVFEMRPPPSSAFMGPAQAGTNVDLRGGRQGT